MDNHANTPMLEFYRHLNNEEVTRWGKSVNIWSETDLTIWQKVAWIMLGAEEMARIWSIPRDTLIATIDKITDDKRREQIPLSIIPEIHAMVKHILELDIANLIKIRESALKAGVSQYQFNQILEAFLRWETNIESRESLQSKDYQKVLDSLLTEFPNCAVLAQELQNGINTLKQYTDQYWEQK